MRRFARLCAVALGVIAVVCAGASSAVASPTVPVPEIDLNVVPAAMGVVTAGVLMLRARRGSK